MTNKIIVTFGKKGSGKTTLTKSLVNRIGGKTIILSPVDSFNLPHVKPVEIWRVKDIPGYMDNQTSGQVLMIRIPDQEAVDCICAYAIYLGMPVTIVIDEVDLYAKSKELLHIIHYGRHFGINLLTNTRRYADVPRLLTSQADDIYIFRTTEPRDIEYIRQTAGKQVANEIQQLKQYEYIHLPSLDKHFTKP